MENMEISPAHYAELAARRAVTLIDYPSERILVRVSLNYVYSIVIVALVAARFWDQHRRKAMLGAGLSMRLGNACIVFSALNFVMWTGVQAWMGYETVRYINERNYNELMGKVQIIARQKVCTMRMGIEDLADCRSFTLSPATGI